VSLINDRKASPGMRDLWTRTENTAYTVPALRLDEGLSGGSKEDGTAPGVFRMPDETAVVYTIGHSNHELETFIQLLRQFGVTAVVDVRSHPYSRLDHFNREALAV
jgi:hypothetical protein